MPALQPPSAPSSLAACASTDYHYSQLYGDRYFKAPIDTYPVTILRVDGKDTAMRPVSSIPGVRKITVQGPPGGCQPPRRASATSRSTSARARATTSSPCRTNRLDSDFTVRIDYEEPVGGCTPPPAA